MALEFARGPKALDIPIPPHPNGRWGHGCIKAHIDRAENKLKAYESARAQGDLWASSESSWASLLDPLVQRYESSLKALLWVLVVWMTTQLKD
jgi:hypothetical protein